MNNEYSYYNPVLAGFYPDPSLVRVDKDYYLCTSTFEFFPGVPLFHSKNLINWEQIGHCLTRESQLPLEQAPPSTGILASTIRYHKGKFYMITTNMTHLIQSGVGNFIVQADNPGGEWSEPVWIDHQGIDPSLLFDDDDKVYYCGTGFDEQGQCIILFQINPDTGEILSEKKTISYSVNGKCPESPHIYKINGQYFLMLAEGGTEYGHMVTIQRGDNIWGPYEACPDNPILTHRNYNGETVQCVGHAELFEDHKGNWWMVCLGARPNGPMLHHIGRETFLLPVTWKNGWPYPVSSKITLEMSGPLPGIPMPRKTTCHTDFDTKKLPLEFNYIRNPRKENYYLDSKNSKMILTGGSQGLSGGTHSPTFLGIRQKELKTTTTTRLELSSVTPGTIAGLCAYYMDTHHYEIRIHNINDDIQVELNKCIYDLEAVTATSRIHGKYIEFKIDSTKDTYVFSYRMDDADFIVLGEGMTAGLATEITEVMTFTGTYIGIFVQNGTASFEFFKSEWIEQATDPDFVKADIYPGMD